LTCDHVHPNQAGYEAIAAAVPLALFTPVTAVPAARGGVVLLLAMALALGLSFATIGSIRHKALDAIADAEADVQESFKIQRDRVSRKTLMARRKSLKITKA
jgi:hypothetical protein